MKIKILLLLSVLLIPSWAFPVDNESIQSRRLKLPSNYEEDSSRIEAHIKEIQNLLARIEVLEHSLSHLQQRLELIDPSATASSYNPSKPIAQNNVEEVPINLEDNIFEAPLKKAEAVPNISKETKVSPKVVVDESADKKLYNLALAAFKENKFEIAEQKFSTFISTYPKSSLQSNAYFWYGETFFKRNMLDKAAINYLKGYKQFPKGAKASDSLLKLALTLGELKKKTEACSMLSRLDIEFPSRSESSIKRAKDAKIKFGCK